ncbi:ABC transporter substrate-binding protein [Paraburkholderia caballeronis]|uniref:NitT/TauT family transport system substrate-binding protein n=1 Tax=Paraburkholderia caballeronis TaxID=416943 RepID=A0A1H7SZ74_9BURK|nr:ABC transporter substrate-binding protein [Paraburkholderia caballeronis]PXW25756.1 NitT/TauT family transport system substrate-binding protein [Paraburkholderia caballeronis]PXX01363.1 NitT/TauT family transport system substrate-binding protein [Paraburkholderia caballeronis]RAJ99283.1 NitT/TauT family transport system substrate-binding protein [Paraburkholderia caballeronis]SEE23815.1 NitT/TauT family transport system substrate-binding protein [Paraburkholderia caballeronis]SEL77952.1 Nit
MKKVVLRFAPKLVLLLAGIGVLGIDSAWSADKVRVGAYASIADAPFYIALDKGFFAEQNLDVQVEQVDSGAAMMTELASGGLDASGGPPSAGVYNAIRQGIDFKIVADKGSSSPGHGYFAFVVREDLTDKIKAPADLKGRVLALTGFKDGVSSEVTLHHLLASSGIKESDINLINMNFGDVAAGLGTKNVEVGVLIEPLVSQVQAQGIATVWRRVDTIYPNQQYGALLYGPGIIKRPDVAKRFMVAYLKAARYYTDAIDNKIPRDELVSILTRHTSVKNPTVYKTMAFPGINPNGTLNVPGMKEDMLWWVSAGYMKQPVDISKIVDTSYAEYAVKKLGAYK